MVKRRDDSGLINLNLVPDTSGIPCFTGSRYRGKKGLCTAPKEYGQCDSTDELNTCGDSFIEGLGFDPRQRIEDATAEEEREALGREYYCAPVEIVVEEQCPFSGVLCSYGTGEVEDGTPSPDYDALRENTSKPWTFWDPKEIGQAVGYAVVLASHKPDGKRLDYREAWYRQKALRNDPETIWRYAARLGFDLPVRTDLPLAWNVALKHKLRAEDRRAEWNAREASRVAQANRLGWFLALVWTILGWFGKRRKLATAQPYPERKVRDKRILPTEGQARGAMKIATRLVWQATNPDKEGGGLDRAQAVRWKRIPEPGWVRARPEGNKRTGGKRRKRV
jgi:hypothetical protein